MKVCIFVKRSFGNILMMTCSFPMRDIFKPEKPNLTQSFKKNDKTKRKHK